MMSKWWLAYSVLVAVLTGMSVACTAAVEGKLTYKLEVRDRLEFRNNQDFSDAAEDYKPQNMIRLRPKLEYKTDGYRFVWHPFWGMYNTDSPRTPLQTEASGNLQLYVDLPKTKDGTEVRIGRQEVVYGDERLIGQSSWNIQGKSFDVVRVKTPLLGGTLDMIGGQCGMNYPHPAIGNIYGANWNGPAKKGEVRELYIFHKDENESSNIHNFTPGFRAKFINGNFTTTTEAAYQFGRTLGRDVSAYMGHVDTVYSLDKKWKLCAEYNLASGGNPGGTGDYKTFDQLFATNHLKYGIADYQGLRNTRHYKFGIAYQPDSKWTFMVDYYNFKLFTAVDNWYGAGGRPNRGAGGVTFIDPTGASGKDAGDEIDLQFRYKCNSRVALEGGWANFNPGSFVRDINGVADNSDWYYIQGTFTF